MYNNYNDHLFAKLLPFRRSYSSIRFTLMFYVTISLNVRFYKEYDRLANLSAIIPIINEDDDLSRVNSLTASTRDTDFI